MNLKSIRGLFVRFWKTEDEKISLLRDVFVALIAVLIIIAFLWAYTGQWFGTPMVAIESGSMEHPDSPFGRLGTIDAGDMVLLVKVTQKDDIITHGEAVATQDYTYHFYGDFGDVIVYRKDGDPSKDQIIHRAMCWLEYHEAYGTYTVEEYGIMNETSVTIVSLGLNAYRPTHSGFITQGDNPHTNPTCDQVGGICRDPIKLSWISGKARSELPWIGTINLFFNDLVTGNFWERGEVTVTNVHPDSIACLVLLITLLISIPISLDIYDYYRTKNKPYIPR
ncbi:MAG: S26 family signal peptidase [Candidatus Thermoplasmatota archaeon]|nr:S26 family signal peptidase [Candidatus Thermoplasmatota archaeon]